MVGRRKDCDLCIQPTCICAARLSTAATAAEARPYFERAAQLVPDDPNLLAMLARVRGLTGDSRAALQAADHLLTLDPESEDGHHQRMLALRELGRR